MLISLGILGLNLGCQPAPTRQTAHKPDSLGDAVFRMRFIHNQLAQGEMPEAEEYVDDHHHHDHGEDGHDHDEHEPYRVEPLQELDDLASWLPELAARSDLAFESWQEVYDTGQAMEKLLDPCLAAADEAAQLGEYQKNLSELQAQLDKLWAIRKELQELPDAFGIKNTSADPVGAAEPDADAPPNNDESPDAKNLPENNSANSLEK